jgi:hypothetical protein
MNDNPTAIVEIAMRSAMLAKASLELLGMQPALARLQLSEVVKQTADFDKYLKALGSERI